MNGDPASQATPQSAFNPDIRNDEQLRDTLQDVLQTISDALHYDSDPDLQGKMLRSLLARVPALRVIQPLYTDQDEERAGYDESRAVWQLVLQERRHDVGAPGGPKISGYLVRVTPLYRTDPREE